MAQCSGCCESCGGCGILLSQPELDILNELARYAFLPVARKADSTDPIYRESTGETPEQYALILKCLEKKGLISLDYDQPLSGTDMEKYADCPLVGSMALTARGQEVLEVADRLGVQ